MINMFAFNNLKGILVLGGVLTVIIVAIVLSLTQPASPLPPPAQTVRTPVPTSFPELAPPSIFPRASVNIIFNTYSAQYQREQEIINAKEEPIRNQALTVSHFIDRLPYSGSFIKVTYNIYSNQVYLEYSRGNKEEALKEFVDLLKSGGIENINWLSNLQIIEK